MRKHTRVIIILTLLIVSFCGGYHLHRPAQEIVTRIEYDTIHDSVPYPIIERVTEVISEPFPEYITIMGDTIRDTIYISLPITKKEYVTDNYRAIISGYKPNLDFMETYNKTEYVTIKEKRWGIGVFAGYGIGKNGLSPYAGLGLYYRIW